MKNISSVLLIFSVLFIFTSCEDFFETTLEIDPPPYEELLVVHAYGNARTNKLEVSVSRSTGLLEDIDNSSENFIDDATVNLLSDAGTFTLQSTNSENYPINYVLPENTVQFIEGSSYTIEVIADGFPTVTAQTIVPAVSSLGPVVFEEDGPSSGDIEFSSIEFVLDDAADQEDFYEAFLLEEEEINGQTFYRPTYILDYLDPVMEQGLSYESILLRDGSFDGLEKSVQLLIDQWYLNTSSSDIDKLYVAFRDVSEDHYLYSRSAHQNVDNAENPFASPVQVYTNMDNGIGIFSIFQERLLKVN